MAVTNIKQLTPGVEIVLPGFNGDGEEVTFRCKRPSILSLASKGLIPNGLLAAAQKVFTESVDGAVSFNEIGSVMETVAKAALIEPSYDDIIESGFELTDDQIAHIFTFVQGGVKALEKFRQKQSSDEDNQSSEGVQEATIGDTGN